MLKHNLTCEFLFLKMHSLYMTDKLLVNRIYPSELHLNKTDTYDTEAPFLDFHLFNLNGFVSSKVYDKRDDIDFDIVIFSFLAAEVPRPTSYGVYISQLIRFARVSTSVADFNALNKCLTAKNFFNRAIGIINFERRSPNFIADTMNWFLN